jgi:alkanesulfonate monooxygenase SsuD/methylene tetrahydromethanopterin reductase-like flavin-dependent oxidoreductase (luciferase family)
MRFGAGLPVDVRGLSGQTLIDWMVRADESLFETIAVTDEIVSHTYDGLVTLAAAAAVTRRVRLMSVVIAGPTRNTAILAKQAASIDALSGGRLALGLGVGEMVEDFAAVGVELRGRGRRFDEQLAQLKRIWADEPVSQSGRSIGPPPARPGGPELLLGGWAPAALARVGRFADGYAGAILAEGMITDEPHRLVEESWREHQRPGRPRLVQNVYYALGERANDAIEDHLAASYSGAPDYDLQSMRKVIPITDSDIRHMVERIESIGADEVIFHPVSAQIDQLARLEQALG